MIVIPNLARFYQCRLVDTEIRSERQLKPWFHFWQYHENWTQSGSCVCHLALPFRTYDFSNHHPVSKDTIYCRELCQPAQFPFQTCTLSYWLEATVYTMAFHKVDSFEKTQWGFVGTRPNLRSFFNLISYDFWKISSHYVACGSLILSRLAFHS